MPSTLKEKLDNKGSFKNLQLQSFSSQQTHSIPINETLEDAIIDLYLSVKIRSNEEVKKFCMV